MAASASDRNLLFGILALHMDFITRDQLVAAMNAWVLDKAKLLGHVLGEQGVLSPERRQLLDALVAEHLRQHDGDADKSLAALSSASSAHRHLAKIADADVRASLLSLAPAGSPRAGEAQADPDATVSAPGAVAGAGRFRILRPHAAGGLGQVSVALDQELNREVALKEIKEQHADNEEAWARFLVEAEITGALERVPFPDDEGEVFEPRGFRGRWRRAEFLFPQLPQVARPLCRRLQRDRLRP